MKESTENTAYEMSEEDAMAIPLPPRIETPPAATTVPALPTEDEILAYTHHTRLKVIDALMVKGVPEDPRIILQALDGMDRQALSRARIQADKEVAQGVGQGHNAILAGLLRMIKAEAPPIVEAAVQAIPQLPSDVPPPQLVVGETDTSPPQDTYSGFAARRARLLPNSSS